MKIKNVFWGSLLILPMIIIQSCEKETVQPSDNSNAAENARLNVAPTNQGKYVYNEKVRLYDQDKANYVEYVVRSNDRAKFESGLEMLKNSTVRFFVPDETEFVSGQKSETIAQANPASDETELIWEEVYKSDNSLAYQMTSTFKADEAADGDRVYMNVNTNILSIQTICHDIWMCGGSSNPLVVYHAHWNYGGWVETNSGMIMGGGDGSTCTGHSGEHGSYTRKSTLYRLNTSQNMVFNYYITP